MLIDDRKQVLVRVLIGGIIGVAALIPVGGLFNDLVSGGLIAMGGHTPFRLVSADLERLVGSVPLAFTIQMGLYFLMGAVTGVSTLPFAEDGRTLVLRSLTHLVLTAGALTLTCLLMGWAWSWQAMVVYLVLLAAVYLLIWLARWVGWYTELTAIRNKLGLAPAHSLFHWREILPYLPFAVGLCWMLPAVLRAFDPADVPLLTGMLLPYVLLPVGGFFSGATLGRRQGVCPLYPILCGLLYLPMVFILYNRTALFHCVIVFGAALLGDLAGAARRRAGKEEKPA